MSPTQRTLARLRHEGWTCAVVERWNPHANCRVDLFGFVDVVALHPDHGILAVQATTASNQAARLRKAIGQPALLVWLQAGGRVAVWGWSKRGPRGQRKLWDVSRKEITLADIKQDEETVS